VSEPWPISDEDALEILDIVVRIQQAHTRAAARAPLTKPRPRCAYVYPSRRRCSNTATSGGWQAVCDMHATSPALAPQEAPGATNGPRSATAVPPNPQIALQRPERTDHA